MNKIGLAIILLLLILARIPSFFEPHWYSDEAIRLTVANNFAAGKVLYSEIFDNAPPALYLIFGAASSLFWAKILATIWVAVTLIVVWELASKLAQNSPKKIFYQVTAGVIFILASTTPIFEGNIANGEIFFILPVALAMLLVAEVVKKKSLPLLFGVGVLFSAASLIKFPAATDLAAALIFLSYLTLTKKTSPRYQIWQKTLASLAPILVGFASLWVVTFLYFFAAGHFSPFFEAVFANNFGYVDYGNRFLIPHGLLILKTLVLTTFIYTLFRLKLSKEKTFIYLWLALALFGVLLSGRGFTHYFIQATVPASLAISQITLNFKFRQLVEAVGVILVFGLIFAIGNFHQPRTISYYQNFLNWITGQKTTAEFAAWFDSRLIDLETISNFTAAATLPSDSIFVLGNDPEIYLLSGRKPATPFVAAYHLNLVTGGPATALKKLTQNPPKIIIITSQQDYLPEIWPFLRQQYKLVFSINQREIWQLANF